MKYYGTKNNNDYGFYLEPFDDCVEVLDEEWVALLEKQATGKIIKPDDNGYPIVMQYTPSDGELAREMRNKRDSLLAKSDWTQLQDARLSPDEKTAWQTYRQALRDVPQQLNFPQEVIWPMLNLL